MRPALPFQFKHGLAPQGSVPEEVAYASILVDIPSDRYLLDGSGFDVPAGSGGVGGPGRS